MIEHARYLVEHEVLESAFFRLPKSLKSKILTTMVPPPGVYYKSHVLSYLEVWTYVSRIKREIVSTD